MNLIPYEMLCAYEWLDTPMWCFDPVERRMYWANAAAAAIWNAGSVSELLARDFSDISDTTITRLQADSRTHLGGRTTKEQWTLYPNGQPLTISAHGFGVMLPSGQIGLIYEGIALSNPYEPGTLRGIEAVQYTRLKIALFDQHGQCLMKNPSAVRSFGVVGDASSLDQLSQLFSKEADWQSAQQHLSIEKDYSAEVELNTLAGIVWHGVDLRWVNDPVTGQPAIQMNARDMSDIKAVEHSLRLAKDEAEAANVAKSRFLATMSHEIRTPMNGVLGMAQLLLHATLSDEERRAYAEVILSSGQTLLSLLNDILDLSKVESGKLSLEAVPLDMGAMLSETEKIFRESILNKGLRLETHWEGPTGWQYRGDMTRIRQMLSNLLGNALKFTESGFIRMDGKVLPSVGSLAVVELSVTDSGIGLTPEQSAILFKPFSQGDTSTTRKYGGTGLGLSIVRSMAEQMGGEVGVESEEGKGSRFWFRIRLDRLSPAEQQMILLANNLQPSEVTPTAKPQPDQATILLVDDNPVNRMVIQAMLKKAGYLVKIAENGEEGLAQVAAATAGEIALVLMDCQMPVMDGFEATKRIRETEQTTGKHLPIVALTADAFKEDREHCLAVGMDDYLAKPVNIQDLTQTIARWVPQTETES